MRNERNEQAGLHSGGGETFAHGRFRVSAVVQRDGLARRKSDPGQTFLEWNDLTLDKEILLRWELQRRDPQLTDCVIIEGETRRIVRHNPAKADGERR